MARVYGGGRREQKEREKKKQQIEKRKLKAGTRSEQGFGSSEEERVVGFFQEALDLQRNQEYARFAERMGDNHQGSRVVGYKGGQIVEVEGGHIVRSTGRKDRHSKVCTAKGPRDRRVRLSAHTAIQFYDVQDRLGYDRPSKAVDWLIKKAKAAIDELAELPAWQPTTQSEPEQEEDQQNKQSRGLAEQHVVSSSASFGFQNPSSNFLPPSLDSDSIADTIKSFFPAANPSTTQFQNYQPELLSRTNGQDLCLSLQSFHDPILLHHSDTTALNHHHRFSTTAAPPPTSEHALFSTVAFGEDAATGAATAAGGGIGFWSWNNTDTGGFHVYNSPPQFAQNQFFTQRGPLQSSHSPSVRARTPPVTVADQHALTSLISAGFSSGGFSGFQIPARIQGEEEQDAVVNRPPSASSASRH